jgi:sugar (pentulose or hexulose) kinase
VDRLALMVGTSGAMRVLWRADSVEIPPGLWCYRSDARRFVMGGALSDGGNLVAWLRKTIRLPDSIEAERAMSQMRPDSHGLTFLPLLAGERGPGWADHAHGIVAGPLPLPLNKVGRMVYGGRRDACAGAKLQHFYAGPQSPIPGAREPASAIAS